MNRFFNLNFIFQNLNSERSCSEAYAMLYEVSSKEQKFKIIKILYNLCNKSLSLFNCPCYYLIDNNNNNNIKVIDNRNTQHFLWCVKAFYQHFKLTNDIKYYNKAENIINYICDKHCYKDKKIFINWFNVNNDNKVSIKSLTCADMLIIFKKEDYLEANINFYKEKMVNKKNNLFFSYYDLNNKTSINKKMTYLHENLELAEGLFNCYEINQNKELYNIAVNIVKSCSKLIKNNVNNLSRLQCYYWMRKYNITENINSVESDVRRIIKIYNKNKYISPYSNNKQNNIFGHIYLQRIYNEFKEI